MIPPTNFWWLSQPPHVFVFQANLSGSPSESFHRFQWFPLLGSQLRLIPPFVLLKIKWSPLKSSGFPPQVINNDRYFKCGDKVTSFLCFFDPCSAYYLGIVPVIYYYYYYFFFGQVRVCEAWYITWQMRIVIINNTLASFLCLLDVCEFAHVGLEFIKRLSEGFADWITFTWRGSLWLPCDWFCRSAKVNATNIIEMAVFTGCY